MAGPVLDDLRQKFHEIVLSHLFLWRRESLEPLINFTGAKYVHQVIIRCRQENFRSRPRG